MNTFVLYVVDDERAICTGLSRELSPDYTVRSFGTGQAAIDAVKASPPDMVLLDIGLPDMNGIDVLGVIKSLHPDIMVIMITAYEDITSVISAMKLGAYDYVVKPLHMESLDVTIRNALETIRLRKQVQALQEKYLAENVPCFIGESNSIQDIMEYIGLVARSPDTPILIVGETGTGKELIAGAVHYRSPNFAGPFITVNCAAIPRDLVESELFGYERGAFSGARSSGKKGLIDAADQGTLFLDEVGDLSLEAQAKLLRFLEEGSFFRIGGTEKRIVKTRIVSATNKDLEALIAQNLFRKDLYFRLGVVRIDVPSLNERPDDILPLAEHFLLQFSKKFGKAVTRISDDAGRALLQHTWSGNVRELRNIIEKAVLIGRGAELTSGELGLKAPRTAAPGAPVNSAACFQQLPPGGIDLDLLHRTMEKFYIEEALKKTGGNQSRAAKLLGMNRHTFRYRRRKCSL